MTKQVKILSNWNIDVLQSDINNFLENNNIIHFTLSYSTSKPRIDNGEIIDSTLSYSMGKPPINNGEIVHSVLISYDLKQKQIELSLDDRQIIEDALGWWNTGDNKEKADKVRLLWNRISLAKSITLEVEE